MHPASFFQRTRTGPEAPGSTEVFVHVLYDCKFMREAASTLSGRLVAHFDRLVNFSLLWSHFHQLGDRRYGFDAAEAAAQADVVVIATLGTGALPTTLARWLVLWMCQRQKPDGMLAGLFGTPPCPAGSVNPMASMLAATARIVGREWLAGFVPPRPELEPQFAT